MIGVVLLYVGGVLLVNGIWIFGGSIAEGRVNGGGAVAARRGSVRLGAREVAVMNFFTGGLGLVLSLFAMARVDFTKIGAADFEFGAFVLLFAFTYLYVGVNQFLGADGRAFGWYCLFVAITAVPTAIITLATSQMHPWPVWLGINWAVWAVLWFLFWVLLSLQRPIARFVGLATVAVAVGTCWLPGYLLLTGYLPGA